MHGDEDDEPIFRFDSHVFADGEYVTITEHDGEDRVFKVARGSRMKPRPDGLQFSKTPLVAHPFFRADPEPT